LFVILLIICLFFFNGFVAYGTADSVVATVKKTDIKPTEDKSIFLIFTDKETFKIVDSLWRSQWRSSDIYGDIIVGHTYKFSVFGWRIPYEDICAEVHKSLKPEKEIY